MRFATCYVFLILGVAFAIAGPTPKIIEKKSLAEDVKLDTKKDLKLEETGGEKDRAKKSATTVCVHIKPGSQPTQTSCNQRQQTVNVVPAPQPQTNIVMPAVQPVQPVHMVHYVQQPAQPCPQPTVNIVQPAPQPAAQVVQPAEPKPQVLEPSPIEIIEPIPEEPKPMPEPARPAEIIVPEPPRPAQIVMPEPLPEPQETLNVLPVAPPCNEQLYTIPSSVMYYPAQQQQYAALVQVPTQCSNPQQHGLQCTCRQRNAVWGTRSSMEPMQAMVMDGSTMPFAYSGYSPNIAAPIVSPNLADSSVASGPQARTTIIKVQRPSHHHTVYHKTYVQDLVPEYNTYPVKGYVNSATGSGITINAYPHVETGPIFRSAATDDQATYGWADNSLVNSENTMASESNDLMDDGTKLPREVSLNQLAPGSTDQIQRRVRSSKDTKTAEKKAVDV